MAKIDEIEFQKLEKEAWHKELAGVLESIALKDGIDITPFLMEMVIALKDLAGKDFTRAEMSIKDEVKVKVDFPETDFSPIVTAVEPIVAAIRAAKAKYPNSYKVIRNELGFIERIVAE